MLSTLSQSYPFLDTWSKRVLVVLGVGLYVMFFLWIFQPLGMKAIAEDRKLAIFGGFSMVSIAVSLSQWVILPLLFPRRFREEEWTVLSEMLLNAWIMFAIGSTNYALAVGLGFVDSTGIRYLEVQLVTLLVGLTPVSVYVLVNLIVLLRRHQRDLVLLNRSLPGAATAGQTDRVSLSSENGKDRVTFDVNALLYVESVDNYVNVVLEERGEIRKLLLRNTLKRVGDQLGGHPWMARCHRKYLINLGRVQSVSGNAQGLQVRVHTNAPSLPVARAQVRSFKAALASMSRAIRP